MSFGEILLVLLNLAGALAVFLFAMKLMSEGLQKFAGSRLRHILSRITGRPLSGILAGAGITAAIQSSTATTVMVVGFAGAGLLTLGGAVAVVMGANIGTTITAWIIALFGLNTGGAEGAVSFSLPMLLATASLFFIFSNKNKMQYLGQTIIGLALLLVGMELLEHVIPQLDEQVVHTISTWSHWGFWSVLLFIVVGAVLTIILQTSAAMTAVILLMASQGWIEFPMALALVMGQNLGTTLTAQVVAMTTGTTGKRAARAHLVFNVAGVLICLILFYPICNGIMSMTGITDNLSDPLNQQRYPLAITIFHTLFNVVTTVVLAFFIPQIVRVVEWMVPEKQEGEEEFRLTYIEPAMLSTAELNLQSAKSEIEEFSKRVLRMYTFLPGLRTAGSEEEFDAIMDRVAKYEGITDRMELELTKFLTRVGSGDVSQHASERIGTMLRIIDNLESIGDTIYQIAMTRKSKREDAVHFDKHLNDNLDHMTELVQHALDVMDSNLHDYDHVDLDAVYAAEHEINAYRDRLRAEHLDALKHGAYNYAIGNAYSSLYALYEKLGDYVINVTEAIDSSRKRTD
ncbi:MAG: phosphate:Na+ symporter [bacterium P3]|nr:MAG: phosphate:Na+ symporter [bacterium P3]KWW40515.1 MAG: phosphate:Na+ symporter [bacterium F083]